MVGTNEATGEGAETEAGAIVAHWGEAQTCEEAYLLARYAKGLSGQVRLALGAVPVVGADDTYPKDRRGKPVARP